MRAIFFAFLLVLIYQSSYTQEKTALSKGETVKYLNKKQEEIIGHYRTVEKNKYYYWEQSVTLSGENIILETTRSTYQEKQKRGPNIWVRGAGSVYKFPCDYWIDYHDETFNPAHIESVELDRSSVPGEPVGIIKITLKSNTGKSGLRRYDCKKVIDTESPYWNQCIAEDEGLFESINTKETVKVVYFTFLQSDDTNFNKIKKALEYLRDLCKAEDDPFGN